VTSAVADPQSLQALRETVANCVDAWSPDELVTLSWGAPGEGLSFPSLDLPGVLAHPIASDLPLSEARLRAVSEAISSDPSPSSDVPVRQVSVHRWPWTSGDVLVPYAQVIPAWHPTGTPIPCDLDGKRASIVCLRAQHVQALLLVIPPGWQGGETPLDEGLLEVLSGYQEEGFSVALGLEHGPGVGATKPTLLALPELETFWTNKHYHLPGCQHPEGSFRPYGSAPQRAWFLSAGVGTILSAGWSRRGALSYQGWIDTRLHTSAGPLLGVGIGLAAGQVQPVLFAGLEVGLRETHAATAWFGWGPVQQNLLVSMEADLASWLDDRLRVALSVRGGASLRRDKPWSGGLGLAVHWRRFRRLPETP